MIHFFKDIAMINCLTKDHHDRIWDNEIVLTIDGAGLCYYNTETKTISDLQTDVCINKWEKWEIIQFYENTFTLNDNQSNKIIKLITAMIIENQAELM